jgi:thiamine-phosphate pyrophosphorylase
LTPATPGARWDLDGRRLYLCTPDRPDLEWFVDACIRGGVDIVQLREKELPDDRLVARAVLVQQVCWRHEVPFILNDRPDLAAAIGADGVHVGQDDMPPSEARRVVGDEAIIGLSTHGVDDLDRAVGGSSEPRELSGPSGPGPAPVDYLSAGPIEPTPTKPGRPGTGLGYLREAAGRARWPVWVTGGVDPTTVPTMAAAGARHFVVVRWLTQAADPGDHARLLRRAIDEAVVRAEEGFS